MSVPTNPSPTFELTLSLQEQWATHAAILSYAETVRERDETGLGAAPELVILEKVETGEFVFTKYELDRHRHECGYNARRESTPDVDAEPAPSVVAKIDSHCPTLTT